MKPSDKEKAKAGAEGLQAFFQQFGDPSTHSKVVFQTLFEVMNEGLSVSSEEGQEGDNDSKSVGTPKQTDEPSV